MEAVARASWIYGSGADVHLTPDMATLSDIARIYGVNIDAPAGDGRSRLISGSEASSCGENSATVGDTSSSDESDRSRS